MRTPSARHGVGVLALGLALTTVATAFDHGTTAFDALLHEHVLNGRVDYRALAAQRSPLDRSLAEMAAVTPAAFASWSEPNQLAFLINLYNAATLRLIVDHYPVESIKDIGGFFSGPWKQEVVPLLGRTVTLNHLEHEVLRKRYREPRIHAALVCAAKGCPPLRNEAYTGAALDSQLTDQMRRFLADPTKNRVDAAAGRIYLSRIFKWYGQDFEQAGRSLLAALAPYWPESAATAYRARARWSLRYTDYDWSLNER